MSEPDDEALLCQRSDAAAEYHEAILAYLNPDNQYTDSRRHAMDEAERALLAVMMPLTKVDPNLEGYWERAYWDVVPKLQRAFMGWADHIPSGYEDQVGYGQVSCSCGWSSEISKLGWKEHIDAATRDSDERSPDTDWQWQCAGCHRPTRPMGMCETCGVFGILRLVDP